MALLKEFLTKSWKRLGLTVLAGVVLIGVGLNLLLWPDSQVGFYNEGLQAYRTGRAQEAVQLFDRSLAVYKQRSNDSWLERFVYPAPSREYASYAAFHKAKALLMLKKGKPAVEAFPTRRSSDLHRFRGAPRLRASVPGRCAAPHRPIPDRQVRSRIAVQEQQAARPGRGQR